jgi:hypothetical protein
MTAPAAGAATFRTIGAARWRLTHRAASVNRRALPDYCGGFFVEVGGFAVPLLGVS